MSNRIAPSIELAHVSFAYRAFARDSAMRRTGWAAAAAALALASSSSAQGICFEPPITPPQIVITTPPLIADFDHDGDADLVTIRGLSSSSSEIVLARNTGGFTFAPAVVIATPMSPTIAVSLAMGDFNGDQNLDVVWVSGNSQGVSQGSATILANDGAGNFSFLAFGPAQTNPTYAYPADFDGDGDLDFLLANQQGSDVVVLRNNGTASLSPIPSGLINQLSPVTAVVGDIDGDGDVDLISGNTYGNHILKNNGTGVVAYAGAVTSPIITHALVDLDGDGDLDLAGMNAGTFQYLPNNGAGSFGAPVIPTGPSNVSSSAFADLDGDGRVDVVLSNFATGWSVLVNQGAGAFTWDASPASTTSMRYPVVADVDGDGDVDVFTSNAQSGGAAYFHRDCRLAGVPYCFGDGSGTPCPCANPSPAGTMSGCRNTLGIAAGLRGFGRARLGNDTFELVAAAMPDSNALYFQGTTSLNGGAGVVFGGGLRCAGGSIVRLAVKLNSMGSSFFPGQGDSSISVKGGVTAPGERTYQVWYRDTPTLCAPQAYNLTNGLRVLWQP